ncbi:unnamed protein product [Rhizoctonia solani]|uniref:Uncharacterized protein n=1 Tax=Rhizoctonia solani TaxID=456999 RepID=A0A8H2WAY0_9AGAM|nr:unnamed protein product [Rhizoctonia solani]
MGRGVDGGNPLSAIFEYLHRRFGLDADRLDVVYSSTNPSISPPYAGHTSDSNHVSPNGGLNHNPAHFTKFVGAQSGLGVHPYAPPEGSGSFISHNSPNGLVSGASSAGVFPQGPLSDSHGTSSPAATGTTAAQDHIAEGIITGMLPTLLDAQLPLFFRDPSRSIESSRLVQRNAAPSRRVFSVPIPTFEVAPAIELPHSSDTTQTSADLDQQGNGQLDDDSGEDISLTGAVASMAGASRTPFFGRAMYMTLYNLYNSRAGARRVPDSGSGPFVRYPLARSPSTPQVLSYASPLRILTGNEPLHRSFPPATPSAFSFTDTSPNIELAGPTNMAASYPDIPCPQASPMLRYPLEQSPVTSPPFISTRNSPRLLSPRTFSGVHCPQSHSPTDTLWLERTNSDIDLPLARVPISSRNHARSCGTNFGSLNCATPYSQSHPYSAFDSDSYDHMSEVELVGNGSEEESMFGAPIRPGLPQDPTWPTGADEQTRRVYVRPFVNLYVPRGARTVILSPMFCLAEHDDEPSPPSPSPNSRVPYTTPPPTFLPGVSPFDSPRSTSSPHPSPQLGYPEDPYQILLSAVSRILHQLNQDEQEQEQDESLFDGNEGDDEDESNGEYEYDQYFSEEDDSVDLEYLDDN